jgi:hypothetical protein
MNFVNPIEILELENINVTDIDNSIIKKAKRKLYAEIELSNNGHIDYKGLLLTKTDCERAIDDLEKSNAKEFYFHLTTNNLLNDFLVNGSEKLFSSFNQQSIYKLPEFIKFISPFFAPKFDKAILKSFIEKDEEKLSGILRTQCLIYNTELNDAFKGLSNEIQNRLLQIDSITKDIKNQDIDYSELDLDELKNSVKELFPLQILNQLPAYFQSQINKIAASINFLQIAIWKKFNMNSVLYTVVCVQLLEYLLELNIESVSKPTFQKNYEIVKKKYEDKIEQEKNEPLIKEWADLLILFNGWLNGLENQDNWTPKTYLNAINEQLNKRVFFDGTVDFEHSITPRVGHTGDAEIIKTHYEKIAIEKERQKTLGDSNKRLYWLNKLPDFADDIRNQFALTLRKSAITVWNKFNDINHSIELINLALSINTTSEINIEIINAKSELEELKNKHKGVLTCFFCDTSSPVEKANFKKTIYRETSRNSYGRTTNVSFQTSNVSIPRCEKCKKTHLIGWTIFYLTFVISFFSLIWLAFFIGFQNDDLFSLFVYIAILSWIISKVTSSIFYNKKSVKNNSELVLKTHPLIKDDIKFGWSFYEPSASNLLMIIMAIGKLFDYINKIFTMLLENILPNKKNKL